MEHGGGVYGVKAYNSIIYFNTAPAGANYSSSSLTTCCSTPDQGPLSSDPLFVALAGGNFRLQANSLCINSGNNAYFTNSTDLDGNPRLMGGAVDIGAYEVQNPVFAISYVWLQQYSLPIDASSDVADPDHDGLNNFGEWWAGTIPNDSSSVLKLFSPVRNFSDISLSWRSVYNKTYYVQRSTNLTAQPAFVTIANNIPSQGQGRITSYSDSTTTNTGPYFYRVGVE